MMKIGQGLRKGDTPPSEVCPQLRGVMDVDERLVHSVSIRGRKQLVMEGVLHVDSFDESGITLETNMGLLILKGEGLHITQLSLETGNLATEGFFTSLQYVEGKGKGKGKGKGILNRILK